MALPNYKFDKTHLGALTITRGRERRLFKPQLLKNIRKQSFSKRSMTHIVIDYEPLSTNNDIFERFKIGVKKAIELGIEWLYIFEDDDYYNELHTGVLYNTNNYDIAGITETVYYNLKSLGFRKDKHKGRASLFATAFKPLSILPFLESRKDAKHLDVELWQWANSNKLRCKFVADSFSCTGIKHGIGLCGGSGHNGLSYTKDDINLSFLASRVDNLSFKFYKNLQV